MNQEYRAIPLLPCVFFCLSVTEPQAVVAMGGHCVWLALFTRYVGGTLLQQLTTHDSRAEKPLQNLAV